MRPTRKAVRFFARALGALAEVLLSERYPPSDICGTAVLDFQLPYVSPCRLFWSEPAEIQGPILKCHLGSQSGTVFA